MVINNLFRTTEEAKTVAETVVHADGSIMQTESKIVCEHSMEVFIDEKKVLKIVCTPSNLVELVLGRLISEGYIASADDVKFINICEQGKRAKVFLKNINSRKEELQVSKLQKTEWKSEWIFGLANEFASGSKIHKATQGTHSCYLSVKGEILFASEDIGRYNAMDKVIGYAVMSGLKREECILYTTGRVSTDMVRKVLMSKIPVLAAKSVPTDAAVEMAKEYNLTLICKAWPDCYEIFNEAHVSLEEA